MNVMAKRDAPVRPDLNNPELNNLAMSKEAQPLFDAVMKHIEENVAPISEKFFKLGLLRHGEVVELGVVEIGTHRRVPLGHHVHRGLLRLPEETL